MTKKRKYGWLFAYRVKKLCCRDEKNISFGVNQNIDYSSFDKMRENVSLRLFIEPKKKGNDEMKSRV